MRIKPDGPFGPGDTKRAMRPAIEPNHNDPDDIRHDGNLSANAGFNPLTGRRARRHPRAMHRMANNDSSARSRASRAINIAWADNNIRIPCEDHHREAMHEERDT